MRKIFLALGLILSVFSFAQVETQNIRYGVTGGLNYSRIRNAHNPSGPRYTFQAGVLALIPIDSDDQFYLQPEVEYYGGGETGKDKNAKGSAGYDAVYADNYISVPILFKGYFSESESEFFAVVGPRFNFRLNQKITDPSKAYYTVDGIEAYPGVNGKSSGFNVAASFGIGYSYKRQIELSAKYDWGFSNVYKNLMNEPGNDPNIAAKKTQHVLSIGLNYIFD